MPAVAEIAPRIVREVPSDWLPTVTTLIAFPASIDAAANVRPFMSMLLNASTLATLISCPEMIRSLAPPLFPKPRVVTAPVSVILPPLMRISSPASSSVAVIAPLLVNRMSLPSDGAATIVKLGAANCNARSSRAFAVERADPSVMPFTALASMSSPAVNDATLIVPFAIRRISSPAISADPDMSVAWTPIIVAAVAVPRSALPVETTKMLSAVDDTKRALPLLRATMSARATAWSEAMSVPAVSAMLRPAFDCPAEILRAAL